MTGELCCVLVDDGEEWSSWSLGMRILNRWAGSSLYLSKFSQSVYSAVSYRDKRSSPQIYAQAESARQDKERDIGNVRAVSEIYTGQKDCFDDLKEMKYSLTRHNWQPHDGSTTRRDDFSTRLRWGHVMRLDKRFRSSATSDGRW